ncbi:MAG: hypothetical protein JST54_15060 [Deltaproteobacteria bacterium]|nr:hypothetical protein [Deltaproteobacteria bacterium]
MSARWLGFALNADDASLRVKAFLKPPVTIDADEIHELLAVPLFDAAGHRYLRLDVVTRDGEQVPCSRPIRDLEAAARLCSELCEVLRLPTVAARAHP